MTEMDMGTLELEEDRRGFFRLSDTQHELIIQPEQLAALRDKIDEFLHPTDERTSCMTETPELREGQRIHIEFPDRCTYLRRAGTFASDPPHVVRLLSGESWIIPHDAIITPLPDPIKIHEVIPVERLPELGVGSAIADTDGGINVWVRDVDRLWYKTGGAVGADDDYFIPSRAFQVLRVGQP
jgi:hypothetical protein